jgi:hypothetical protein
MWKNNGIFEEVPRALAAKALRRSPSCPANYGLVWAVRDAVR